MAYQSTKTFGHELGLSCAFRQWRATSHCNQLHGYAISISLIFEASELDKNNWVMDFGGLKEIKAMLQDYFDHRTVVAKDDPKLHLFELLAKEGVLSLTILNNVGCEAFSELVFNLVDSWLGRNGHKPRVSLILAEVREHGANSAIYVSPKATFVTHNSSVSAPDSATDNAPDTDDDDLYDDLFSDDADTPVVESNVPDDCAYEPASIRNEDPLWVARRPDVPGLLRRVATLEQTIKAKTNELDTSEQQLKHVTSALTLMQVNFIRVQEESNARSESIKDLTDQIENLREEIALQHKSHVENYRQLMADYQSTRRECDVLRTEVDKHNGVKNLSTFRH